MSKNDLITQIASTKRELVNLFPEKKQIIDYLCEGLFEIANSQGKEYEQNTEEWLEEWLATAICSE